MRTPITSFYRIVLAALAAAVLAGCTLGPKIDQIDFEMSQKYSRNEILSWKLEHVEVVFPKDMGVSTDPTDRYPSKELLVWWGDPPGDRFAQVTKILQNAAFIGANGTLSGDRGVNMMLYVDEFHAMTPKARNTDLPFGVHELKFNFAFYDAVTGKLLVDEDGINADMRAFSGPAARQADEVGQTEKVRITDRISVMLRKWLRTTECPNYCL